MTEAARRYGLGALAHRNFRLFFIGQGISLVGTWMQNVGEGWLILTLTNSPFYVGLTAALSSVGVLLFSLYAGVIADRTDKRRVIILMQVAFMLEAFTVSILVWTGVIAVWQVLVLAGLLMMRLPPYSRPAKATSSWSGFREVLAYLKNDRKMRTLMLLTAIFSVFGFPYIAMMPVFARDVLHRGAGGYGALTSSIGVGAVIGALAIALTSGHIKRRGRLMLVGGAAFGVLLMLFAASRVLWLAMPLLALTGCAMIINNSLGNTLLQTSAPDHLRGRVMGFYSFVFVGMAPFGAFLFGLVAEHVGVPTTLAAGGAIVMLAVTIVGWLVPEIRNA